MLGCILWKLFSLTNLFFKPQTKLNYSSSNPNNFYILVSNTITDKCTLLNTFVKTFSTRFAPPHQVFCPNLDRAYTYIHILKAFNS